MRDRHAVMGVSLANRKFTRRFVRGMHAFADESGFSRLEVVVFDEIESINYCVFRGIDREEALRIARNRGREIHRMFEGVFRQRRAESCSCECESSSPIKRMEAYEKVLCDMRRAYCEGERFAHDVDRQVLQNLKSRTEQYGEDFVLARVGKLVEYIFGEIAFFEVYWRLHRESVEVYPGPNLFVKENMWLGAYPGLETYRRADGGSYFVDVSDLSDVRDDDS